MSAYAVKIENCFDVLQSLYTATDRDTSKEEILEPARLVVRNHPMKGRSSVSAETLAIIDESRAERLTGEKMWHRELVKR